MRNVWIILFIIFVFGGIGSAQELSTFVYPSEDELNEAYFNGEIDFGQLLILQEIIQFGIDSTQLYLLDEIPNLAYFLGYRKVGESELTVEQESAYLDTATAGLGVTGKFRHYYAQRIETDGDSRYRSSGEINIGEDFRAAFRLHKEYSGNERFVYRKLEYRPKNSTVRQILLGNYTTRLGLGTIVGYRGKLVNFSNEIDGESFLYPDYGGYNGLDLKIKRSTVESELIYSQTKGEEFSIRTVAGSISNNAKKYSPMIIASLTNIRNRSDDSAIYDFKYGFNLETKYKNGYNRSEISAQAGERNSFGAVVSEGRHLFEQAEVNYALWHYGDEYLDLTGGSKSASISQSHYLPEVDFNYTSKRDGQSGGLLKTIVELGNGFDLVNSLIYAKKDKYSYNFEFLPAIEKKLSNQVQIRIDHLSRIRHRSSSIDNDNTFRRSRIELRFVNPTVYVRTYLAYQSKTDEDDYMSLFANCKIKSEQLGETSVWLNIGEFNHNEGEINYWYGYLQNKQSLFDNVNTFAKLSHSFRRNASDEHVSTFEIGLEVII